MIIRWFKTKYYEFKYRNVDEYLCCCGDTMEPSRCTSGLNCCRSAKEYAVTSAVNKGE